MIIRQASINDFQKVIHISQTTIRTIYPRYYPSGAVQYFCDHHSDDRIHSDIVSGIVYLLENDTDVVGTVTINGNRINRLFVLPQFQHKGYELMIACLVNRNIAGNCLISFNSGIKDRHRASVAIALLQEYWGLGIGTRMFEEMFQIARERDGVRQIELDFIEGNSRARSLYEKMGFRITGVKPDAIRMKDGSYVNEYMMVKRI